MAKAIPQFRKPANEDESAPASSLVAVPTSQKPGYREGKKNLSCWIDKKMFLQFKVLAAQKDITIQDYLIRLLNQEFAKEGLPQFN